ncbi:hypothetical protein RchiOBHm_Chr6g0310551 [Rosa chinensis]|uniref:Uncharacterized protein n=1 Tax=Rosa chinensis TaxID=74649 RepID=A0A2P6Q153_ROSCH|nr:hypothetical protein RchiOBHm_Chr6g0310551 [Rosa chinensis]
MGEPLFPPPPSEAVLFTSPPCMGNGARVVLETGLWRMKRNLQHVPASSGWSQVPNSRGDWEHLSPATASSL